MILICIINIPDLEILLYTGRGGFQHQLRPQKVGVFVERGVQTMRYKLEINPNMILPGMCAFLLVFPPGFS